MKKKVFTAKFKFLLVVLFLVGFLYGAFSLGRITKHENPADIILDKLEAAMWHREEVSLSDVIGKNWDEVCIFYPQSSHPESGYLAYQEIAQRKIVEGKTTNDKILPAKPYSLIFLITIDGHSDHYGTRKSKEHLMIDGKEYWLKIKSQSLGGCLTGEIIVKKHSDLLLISSKGE